MLKNSKLCIVGKPLLFSLALFFCFSLSSGYGQTVVPFGKKNIQTGAPFSFVSEFPMTIKATLRFDKELGGGTITVNGSGAMTLIFTPTSDPDVLTIRLSQINIKLNSFEFPLPSKKSIKIEGIRLSNEDFDIDAFQGTLNRQTEEVALRFVIVLDPKRHKPLSNLGINDPQWLVANEKGRMNLVTKDFDTHADPFSLGSGILSHVTVFGGQLPIETKPKCQTRATLCVSTATHFLQDIDDFCPDEVWICPGEEAILYYKVTSDVTTAKIHPGVGSVSGHTGKKTVKPTSDTEYVLTADGNNCTKTKKVWVRVLSDGDTRTLRASNYGHLTYWSTRIAPETTSSDIMITSIKTLECLNGAGLYPLWNAKKTDVDGTVNYFDVFHFSTSPGSWPLVGNWEFVPQLEEEIIKEFSTACFKVTLKCR